MNDDKPNWVVGRVKKCADKFKDPVIACLGLAFKADVDDLRESPAFSIVKQLESENVGQLLVCEPNLSSHPDFDLCTVEAAIEQADIVLVLVDHSRFKSISAAELSAKVVIDTRGVIR